jgi:hypothetical protein
MVLVNPTHVAGNTSNKCKLRSRLGDLTQRFSTLLTHEWKSLLFLPPAIHDRHALHFDPHAKHVVMLASMQRHFTYDAKHY